MTITPASPRSLAIALAAMAALVPAARAQPAGQPIPAVNHAAPAQDLRSPDARDAALLRSRPVVDAAPRQDLRSPDARHAALLRSRPVVDAAPRQDLRSPDTRDAARPRPAPIAGLGAAPPPVRPPDFDWPSAGIGAGTALAILAGIALVGRRRTRYGALLS